MTSQENTNQLLVHKMIETVFQGSATQLVLSALGKDEVIKDFNWNDGGNITVKN